ncbi:hypothetical protein L0P57_05900 [Anaeromassilibacillus senegalensis]|uniref:Uncharacterized protein n=1 Tax=Anaeromassilibacillus senegalensis TaxID=1673717 RepID=A0ABS9MI26_9FIRM|nr:hypothetical protein [Anaeromassilibacillus senegalensis]MCG4610464.1 hypothetical protein [Anaeromassilibacillus senegalensis]
MKENLLIGGCAALVLVALSAFGLWHTQGDASYHMDPDLAQFGVSYTVEPTDIESKIVSVSIELTPDKLSPDRMFYLDIGEVEASEPVCTDADGTEIALNNLGSAWEIGPVSEDCESVVFQYDVKLGENTGVDFQVDGDLYEDLLAFQGKKVLMMPLFDSNNLTHMEKYISSVSFQLAGGSDWNAIIPFAPANSSEKSFQLERPTWYDYYDLINSSYCFGSFEPLNLSSGGENAVFYLDSAIRESAELNDLSMVISFYNYYTGVFGSNLDKPVVLLRTNEDGESTILSGVGGQSAAISLSMYTPDACQTMSRTLYHAFFDSKVHARNLHYQPNEWLYRGLGDRYVNASAEALPQELKDLYGIQVQDDLNTRYMKYLFISLKDPVMASLSSDMEGSMAAGQEDFYFNVKVPLILETIESFTSQKQENALLHYLMEQPQRQDVNISRLMQDLLGDNEEMVRAYFSGTSFIPNYWNLSAQNWSAEDTVNLLAGYEDTLSTLFDQQYVLYPYDPVFLIKTDRLYQEIEERDLSFATPEVEQLVKDYSETLYLLLMQNALRADLCGIDDPGAAGVKTELNSQENGQIWADYVASVGMEELV